MSLHNLETASRGFGVYVLDFKNQIEILRSSSARSTYFAFYNPSLDFPSFNNHKYARPQRVMGLLLRLR